MAETATVPRERWALPSGWAGMKTGVGPTLGGLKLIQFEGVTNTKLGTRLWKGVVPVRGPEA